MHPCCNSCFNALKYGQHGHGYDEETNRDRILENQAFCPRSPLSIRALGSCTYVVACLLSAPPPSYQPRRIEYSVGIETTDT